MKICQDRDEPNDLLMTDVVMPLMNGPKLRENIVKIFSDIKTIYISGYSDDKATGLASSGRETYFLQKPFKKKLLLNSIRRAFAPEHS